MVRRPYQDAAIYSALSFLENKNVRATLIVSAVRSGKTATALGLADIYTGNGRTLVVTPRAEIARQWADEAEAWHPGRWECGVIYGRKKQFGGTLTATTLDSGFLHINRILAAGDYRLLIFDEAHRALSNTGTHIIDTFLNAGGKVLFVTATPGRSDNKSLDKYISGVAFSASTDTMRRLGVAVDVNTITLQDTDMRSAYKVWSEHAHGRQTVGFTRTKTEAAQWAAHWRAHGVAAADITSDTPPRLRAQRLSDYKDGKLTALFNAGVLTEGVNINMTECVILAERPVSNTSEVQRVGRALGSSKLKDNAVAIICGVGKANRLQTDARTSGKFVGDGGRMNRNSLGGFGRFVHDLLVRAEGKDPARFR